MHRLRRRSRRLARWVAIGFVSTLVLIFVVLTQTGVTRSYVLPKVAALLPGEVMVGGVHLGLNGDIVIEDLVLRAPGVPGDPSEFFRTKRLRVSMDIFSLGSDKPRATSLTLVEPVARVSVDKRSNGVNLSSVVWPGGGSGGTLPKVYVRRGIIELGEHEGSTYDVLRRVSVDGELAPAKEGDGSYTLSARELNRVQPGGGTKQDDTGFIVDGRLSSSAVELTLRRLVLSDWRPESVPTIFRDAMRRMNIEGVVDRAKLDYDFKEGLSATLDLRGVGMNLPVSGSESPNSRRPAQVDAAHPAMRMRDVTGTIELTKGKIEARATGNLEELPYTVRLQYLGSSADAPFVLELNAEGFELQQHPNVLRFAPEVARHWADNFSNPTGIFDTWVEVSRGPGEGGKPGDIAVRGRAKFRGVTAAFHKFPYQFNDMSGVFYFDDKAIEMRDIEGRSAQGATVHASGVIAPPDETAEVNLDIRIKGAPIDKAMLEAIGPARRQIIDDLVSKPVFDDMSARGLITRAETIDQVIDGPAPEAGKPPLFALSGKADVDVLIRRARGKDAEWSDEVNVEIPRVGMLPDKFRYPIIGEDVKLRIAHERAEVIGGRFRGLHGGLAQLTAALTLPDPSDTRGKVSAVVDVKAGGVPFDSLLLYAIPDSPINGMSGEAKSVRQIVDMMQLSGTMDCTAHIGDEADGSMGYVIAVSTRDAKAAPRREAGPTGLKLESIDAGVRLEPSRVEVTIKGDARRGDAAAGRLDVAVEASLGEASREHAPVKATLDVRGLDIAAPVEDLAAIFSLDACARILELRNHGLPGGKVGVHAELSAPFKESGNAWTGSLVLDQADGLYFSIPEGRVIMSESTGRVVVRGGDPARVTFENFDALVSEDAGPVGRVGIDGAMNLNDEGGTIDPSGLKVSVKSLSIGAPLTRQLIENRVGEPLTGVYKTYAPTGTIDGEALVVPGKDGPSLRSGWLGPRSLAFDMRGQRIEFPGASGRIDLHPPGGTFSALTLDAPTWSVRADGAWSMKPAAKGAENAELAGNLDQFEATYDLTSMGLPKDLIAVLPEDVTGVLRELDAGADGRVSVKQGTLSIRHTETAGAPRGLTARGTVGLEKARLNVGVPISDCDGMMSFEVEKPEGGAARFNLSAELPVLRISGVRMSQGLVRVESGTEPGRVRVPFISATCHNGRLAGDARIEPGPDGKRHYDARLQISGARFGPLLADLREGSGKAEPKKKGEDDPDARGSLDAELSLSGIVGDGASRRGRGTARIGGGRVLSMPLTMALIRFSNFQLPIDERLELAKASFYIDGPVIGFDELGIYSRSIEISGGGTMTWPETTLDMRFNSRSLSRVPVISEIIEGIRDNLITTRVRGTLDEPEIGVAAPGESRSTETKPDNKPEAKPETKPENRPDSTPAPKPPAAGPAPAVPAGSGR